MKIAVTGKGGVGKTTVSALMARYLSKNHTVLLIDADPDMNAADLLNIPQEKRKPPIVELKELIAERTGSSPDEPASYFKLNPRVDDIPDTFCVQHDNIKLITMGTVKKGGGGCVCPENTFVRQLVSHLVLQREDFMIMDMEAGIEHLGRGTAGGVDVMIVVIEPNRTSIETAHRIYELSADIGIQNIKIIGNKIHSPEDRHFLQHTLNTHDFIGFIDYSQEMRRISIEGVGETSFEISPFSQIAEIAAQLILQYS